MSVVGGAALILASLLAWLVGQHFKSRRYFDRPALARNPWFDPIAAVLHWLLLAAGLMVLARASLPLAVAAAAILLAGWAYRRYVRSVLYRRRMMRREFAVAQRRTPDLPEREVLFQLVVEKHPRWGEELIEQMVNDYPTVDCHLAETHLGYGTYGAFGIGENIGAAMSAITSSAIHNATGEWILDYPITPDKVLKVLGKV